MSSSGQAPQQGQGPVQQQQPGPPFAPRTQSLGGVPNVLPDVPASAAFLVVYIAFAIIHIRILKGNNKRGHKFIFNGAIFAFCMIRIITMSLRIAWANRRTNISLAIAAQIFVNVGTVILYGVNWFFTQRIVRAQHSRWGWSKPYRVLHRAALFCLIATLAMLVVAGIQQFFTQSAKIHHIDRSLQLTGQTYFAAFSFGPLMLVTLSLILPRKGTEKFGAGRLRNNIAILLVASSVLFIGQLFRCVTTWLPPTPLRTPKGIPLATPWYLSRACFYTFNFTTELFVVIFYAVSRVDLRFHIPDGAKRAGDYWSQPDDQYHVNIMDDEKSFKRESSTQHLTLQTNQSNDTLHEYEASIFDDRRTLADSLRYPSSILEVDARTGHYKVRRASNASSLRSGYPSPMSAPSLWSPDGDAHTARIQPPVPSLPPNTNWPLRESEIPRNSVFVMEHPHWKSRTRLSSPQRPETSGHEAGQRNTNEAIAGAMVNLEANSEKNNNSKAHATPSRPTQGTGLPDTKPPSRLPRDHAPTPAKQLISAENYPQSLGTSHFQPGQTARSSAELSFKTAKETFCRFSYEILPKKGEKGYIEGAGSESEASYERKPALI